MEIDFTQLQAPTGFPPHVWTDEEKAHLENALRDVAAKEKRRPEDVNFSTVANAHECAHLPPPTPEDEARLSAALDKIFPKDSKMTEATATTIDMNEVTQQSAEAATELMNQAGWDIVKELHLAALDSINQTGLIVLPIMANLDDYKLILNDPVGFENSFQTLSTDISHVMAAAKALGLKSEGKSGAPTADELQTISQLTMDYTKVQGFIERTIHPLMLALVEQLEAVGVTELSIAKG